MLFAPAVQLDFIPLPREQFENANPKKIESMKTQLHRFPTELADLIQLQTSI